MTSEAAKAKITGYVHDYGPWHIVEVSNGTLCGAFQQPGKGGWASYKHWHEPQGLTIDDRAICAICLVLL